MFWPGDATATTFESRLDTSLRKARRKFVERGTGGWIGERMRAVGGRECGRRSQGRTAGNGHQVQGAVHGIARFGEAGGVLGTQNNKE